jgi:hypothetical protein
MTTALEGVRGQRHALAALYPGKDPVPIVQEAGWAPGSVWIGAENLAPTGFRSPDRPARSQSLYRLRYPALHIYVVQRLRMPGDVSEPLRFFHDVYRGVFN